jgi:hypothetical protein
MSGKANASRAKGRAANDLVLVGGGTRAQVRKASRRDWTKAKEQRFLTVLAETCNVSRACEEAGVSDSGAYQRRKANAAFRAAWLDAIGTAYQRLELVLLERALNGTEKIVTKSDGREERMREYPNQIALTLLRMHRDTAAEAQTEVQADDVEEIRQRLLEKLERLRERYEREESAGA